MSAKSDRRKLVNAGVVAGSAAMFAAAWMGVVRADGGVPAAVESTTVPTANVASSVGAADVRDTTSAAAASTPAPTRRIVVVRQSRAS